MTAPARLGTLMGPSRSRRVSAGITPAPGTTSRLPVWWGRADWIDVEVHSTVRDAVEVCRDHHIAPDTVIKVAKAHAESADALTGRNCRPTNKRLLEVAQCSLSTVKRARRVLMELGLMVEVVAGRSNMTLQQRLVAHENGSSHRAIAAEFALCSRRDRRPTLVDNPATGRPAVDRDPPPVGKVVRTSAREFSGHLRSKTETRKAAPRPAPSRRSDEREAGGFDLATRRLTEAVRRRVSWLRDVHPLRMAPTLAKFARAGWTARDVERAIAEALAARGKRVPAVLDQAAAYLAWLLREVDPADRPGALEEWRLDVERRQRAYQRQLVHGRPCPHGQPAGDVPSPMRGSLACPTCRASASAG